MRTRPKTSIAEAGRAQRRARHVGPWRLLVAALLEHRGRERGRREPERDDDEEAPWPAERGGQDTAEHEPGDHPHGQRGREHPERPLALALLPEGRGQ
jgi:hypothetical protein